MDIAGDKSLGPQLAFLQTKGVSPAKEAEHILDFLFRLNNGKLILFFDNLESVQEGTAPQTLFNIGHIHLQNKELEEAMKAWITVYGMAKKIGLAQALDALENLAGGLGLRGKGLEAWERLLNQTQEGPG